MLRYTFYRPPIDPDEYRCVSSGFLIEAVILDPKDKAEFTPDNFPLASIRYRVKQPTYQQDNVINVQNSMTSILSAVLPKDKYIEFIPNTESTLTALRYITQTEHTDITLIDINSVRRDEYFEIDSDDVSTLRFTLKQKKSNQKHMIHPAMVVINTMDYYQPYEKFEKVTLLNENTSLRFKLYDKVRTTDKKVLRASEVIYSDLTRNLLEETFVKTTIVEIESSIVDTGVCNNGNGVIGDLEMLIEVHRYELRNFKFPKGYLKGLLPSTIATAVGDILTVYTVDFGDTTLYTDHGTITIRTVPGFALKQNYQILPNVFTPPLKKPTETNTKESDGD